jgi:chromosome segregation ATPase
MDTDGQEPTIDQTPAQAAGRDYDAEIAELRKEAAKWRTQYREASGKLKDIEPAAQRLAEMEAAQQTEAQRLAAQLADLQTQVVAAQAAAQRADAERKLALLATKAGVPPAALPYLDATKFDLDDEAAALEALAVLAASNKTTAPHVGATNPARSGANGTPDPAEWYKQMLAGGSTIFDLGG